MDKQELKEKFDKNVAYLYANIPPDDIYIFTEQTLMAAMFFLNKYSKQVNITEEMLRDPMMDKWVRNIMGLVSCREKALEINIDLNMQSLDEDSH